MNEYEFSLFQNVRGKNNTSKVPCTLHTHKNDDLSSNLSMLLSMENQDIFTSVLKRTIYDFPINQAMKHEIEIKMKYSKQRLQ